ncbi:hypothetical protein WS75_29025 [Burkholderia sp. FL-7-2-10-S1-D7]|nr:hypothetical protein WS75_29025 [Burkholderia sp. FL-7-2-10-S1-D7]
MNGSAGVSFARALVSMAVDRCASLYYADAFRLSHETRIARKFRGGHGERTSCAESRTASGIAVVPSFTRGNKNDCCNMRNNPCPA